MDFVTDPFLIDKQQFSGPVLVTGAGGCIGAWTCAILSRSGVPVIASDLTKRPTRASMIMGAEAAYRAFTRLHDDGNLQAPA